MGPGPEAEAALNSDPQEASRPGAPGSERILLDILEHDWREAQDSRQELCQKLHTVQGELQWAEELRDKVWSPVYHPHPALPPPSFLHSWGGSRGGEGGGHHQFTCANLPCRCARHCARHCAFIRSLVFIAIHQGTKQMSLSLWRVNSSRGDTPSAIHAT